MTVFLRDFAAAINANFLLISFLTCKVIFISDLYAVLASLLSNIPHFHVTHKKKSNDLSKVSYRLMGRNAFVKTLVGNTEMQKYVLQRNGKTTFCPKSESEIITDTYKLKN
jgi:hypothetical protein